MARQQWRNASTRKCEAVDSILRQMVRAGARLPGPITDVAWDLLDLAVKVYRDDTIWRVLPRDISIDGYNKQTARQLLGELIEESK